MVSTDIFLSSLETGRDTIIIAYMIVNSWPFQWQRYWGGRGGRSPPPAEQFELKLELFLAIYTSEDGGGF